MGGADSATLLKWQRERDAEAFAELAKRYSGLVYGTCWRILRNSHDAQEMSQECFLRLSHADAERTVNLAGWLHRVATNLCLERLRKERGRNARERAYAERRAAESSPAWGDIEPVVDEAIDALPEKYRQAIVLHFLEGMTHGAIAESLGISRSAVSKRIERGIKRVRTALRRRGVPMELPALVVALGQGFQLEAPPALLLSLNKVAVSGRSRVPAPLPRPRGISIALLTAAGIVVLAVLGWLLYPRTPIPEEPRIAARVSVTSPIAAPAPVSPPVQQAARLPEPSEAAPGVATGSEPTELPRIPGSENMTVRCLDPDGNPIEGAEVYVRHCDIGLSHEREYYDGQPFEPIIGAGPARTDGNGIARFGGLPRVPRPEPGEKSIYPARVVYARVPDKWVGIQSLVRADVASQRVHDVRLVPSTSVMGRVVVPPGYDPRTVTICYNSVFIADERFLGLGFFTPRDRKGEPLWPDALVTHPDETGEFVLPNAPKLGNVHLDFKGPGLADFRFTSFWPTQSQDLTVPLEPEAVVEGRVIGPSGEPMPGLEIGGSWNRDSTTTDANGCFRLARLGSGKYALRVDPGRQPSEWNDNPVWVNVERGQTVRDVTVKLDRGAILTGRVTDAVTGKPIPGVAVGVLNGAERTDDQTNLGFARTDSEGVYRYRLPSGPQRFYLASEMDGYIFENMYGKEPVVDVPTDRDVEFVHDFQLVPAEPLDSLPHTEPGLVRGRVVDQSGEPVADVPIEIVYHEQRRDHERNYRSNFRLTDAEGRYEYEVDTPCTFMVHAGRGRLAGAFSPNLTVESGQTVEVEDLAVHVNEGVLDVTVLDAAGKPIPSARVNVGAGYDPNPGLLSTDDEGRLRVKDLRSDGKITLVVEKAGYRKYKGRVPVGGEQRVVLKKESAVDE